MSKWRAKFNGLGASNYQLLLTSKVMKVSDKFTNEDTMNLKKNKAITTTVLVFGVIFTTRRLPRYSAFSLNQKAAIKLYLYWAVTI